MTFQTPTTSEGPTLTGPARFPVQMLAHQKLGDQLSVHDEEMAAKVGLAGAPIEGPTHFSQFDPLAFELWGQEWFEKGCISSHFQTMVLEGESVTASLKDLGNGNAEISAQKAEGTPVLEGTASVEPNAPTALSERLQRMRERDPGELHIIDRVEVGTIMTIESEMLDMATPNGDLYPFSLRDKLDHITEASPWYESADNPWQRPIVPFEMYSVLTNKVGAARGVRRPSTGLFIDLEVRAVDGPLLVDEPYNLEKEIILVGQSRRVESYWSETRILETNGGRHVATVLLHQGVFKASYADYPDSQD